jgi:hypothetical protein
MDSLASSVQTNLEKDLVNVKYHLHLNLIVTWDASAWSYKHTMTLDQQALEIE